MGRWQPHILKIRSDLKNISIVNVRFWLVVSTPLKNISQIGNLSLNRGENKKIFETITQISIVNVRLYIYNHKVNNLNSGANQKNPTFNK